MEISDLELEKKIKEKLRIKGITFKDLALKIGMTEAGLYSSLKKNTIKFESLIKISKVIEVPLLYFIENNITAIIDEDINRLYSENKELKEKLEDKQQIVEYLNQKDHANQDILINIIETLSKKKDEPCKIVLAEIKKLEKVKFLIEYGLINPDIFNL